jgi:hypothetical protein
MQIIRNSSFRASPWKNGGGMTHEVIRVPLGTGVVSLDIGAGAITNLQAWDLLVAVPEDRVAVGPAAPAESAAPLVFFATLDDNSP